ncbi:protein of unknown function DUF1771 [Dillenia turbinata]|uniref:DUF1771 domain-containing protein n=1 Tax=Dillenia turbinata TaxID=194707 RepID=A0AAN8VMB1_9MAGN
MDASSSSSSGNSEYDHRMFDLNGLLDAFGSALSLDDIASVYYESGCNVDLAGQILSDGLEKDSGFSSNPVEDQANVATPSLPSSNCNFLNATHAEENPRSRKPKMASASMGSVSGIIGKNYAHPRKAANMSLNPVKPMILDSNEFPASEIWDYKEPEDITTRASKLPKDIDFLVGMLRDDFKLDKNVVQEVLGKCGYNMELSMEKLLLLSASTLGKSDDIIRMPAQQSTEEENIATLESKFCQEKFQSMKSTLRDGSHHMAKNKESKQKVESTPDGKSILQSLFVVQKRIEEAPRRIIPPRRVRAFGDVVVQPLRETSLIGQETTVETFLDAENDIDEEDNYDAIRQAVRENWRTMREYYKAAVEAYIKGDYIRAQKLKEQGQYFNKKAHEADEKSIELLFADRKENLSIDLQGYDPKDAIRNLKVQLQYLCGIPCIKFLKIKVGMDNKDSKQVTRKRLILKFLARESIKWTEGENGGSIVIRIDEIDPKGLSIVKRENPSNGLGEKMGD